MDQLQRGDCFRIPPTTKSRQLDDELILLDTRGGEYFSLNASGASVWRGIERGLDLGTVEAQIAGAWPIPAEERWDLITAIVSDLLARNLISHLR